jgi:hypothetical protein
VSAATAAAIALAGLTALGLIAESLWRRADRTISRQHLDLLRRQIEAEAAARLERVRAEAEHTAPKASRLVASQGQISGGEFFDRYTFTITNAGPAAVFAPRLWAAGDGLGTPVISEVKVAPVLLAEATREFTIEIPRDASDAGGLALWGAWTDDAGEHMEPLLSEIRKLR